MGISDDSRALQSLGGNRNARAAYARDNTDTLVSHYKRILAGVKVIQGPTQINRQGPRRRVAVPVEDFYTTDAQREEAIATIAHPSLPSSVSLWSRSVSFVVRSYRFSRP